MPDMSEESRKELDRLKRKLQQGKLSPDDVAEFYAEHPEFLRFASELVEIERHLTEFLGLLTDKYDLSLVISGLAKVFGETLEKLEEKEPDGYTQVLDALFLYINNECNTNAMYVYPKSKPSEIEDMR